MIKCLPNILGPNHVEIKIQALRNMIINLIRTSKQTFFKNYFEKNSNSDADGHSINDPSEISNSFNDYFSTIADSIFEERKYTGDGNFSKYLHESMPKSLSVDPFDGDEMNKANGPTSIPTDVLSFLRYDIQKPLS